VPVGSCVSRVAAVSGPETACLVSLQCPVWTLRVSCRCSARSGHRSARPPVSDIPYKMSLGHRAIRPGDVAFKPCLQTVISVCMLYCRMPVGAARGRTQELFQILQRHFKPCNFVAFLGTFV
jgi:hypothetical protein